MPSTVLTPDSSLLLQKLRNLTPSQLQDYLSLLSVPEKRRLTEILETTSRATQPREWHTLARPKQLPPHHPRHHQPDKNGHVCGCSGVDTDYTVFILCAGRGLGKTFAGANNIIEDGLAGCPVKPGERCRDCPHTFAVVAPTRDSLKYTCFGGSSGIIRSLGDVEHDYNKSDLIVTLRNGNMLRGFSAENPERYRGPNLSGAWVDELGTFRYDDVWDQMTFALRVGVHPRIYVTTTPRPTKRIRELFARTDGSVHVTTGSTFENQENLSAVALAGYRAQYEGTRLGRQELYGQLLEDVEGALWTREMMDACRIKPDQVPADLVRVVVAVDPAVTSGEDSDENGIVVCAEGPGRVGYILGDYSMRGSPKACMERAVWAYHNHDADALYAEVNNGGDYIGNLVHSVDPSITYREVRATRGKQLRAQPISAVFEQGRGRIVGSLPELEDQMAMCVPGESLVHDDRLDAMVYAMTALRGLFETSWLSAYHLTKCYSCQGSYNEDLPRCDKCGAVNDEAAA
jgi:phage terminase large subunit-like protein